MMVQVYLSIGSNIDPAENIRASLTTLQQHYGELSLSSVYETEAVGFEGDNFYNLVVGFHTAESPSEIAHVLRDIEHLQGRRRSGERFSARTLDIDLILYGDLVLKTAQLEIPRDEILKYAFVLGPLAELAPDAQHPVTGQRYAELWARFNQQSQPMTRVELP